jgi:predicted GNAT family N-acyltransferase
MATPKLSYHMINSHDLGGEVSKYYLCIMIEIVSFKIADRPDLAAVSKHIRQHVFVEEQDVDPALEYDEYENDATHYLLYENQSPVATARWRETKRGIKLERFATLKSSRNKGLGAKLLDKVLDDLSNQNMLIYLNSQLKAIPFYQRRGFKKVGSLFIEAEIEHIEMQLDKE